MGSILKEIPLETVKSATQEILKEPEMYRVMLLNDDYTPMDFVVKILETFFGLDEVMATTVMLQVHKKGRGLCGVFTQEIAETKVFQVNQCAKQCEYPLLCCMEPDTL